MANRRMFSNQIINSARFLRMPSTTRLLYYDLGMKADDDGFVESFSVLRATGASEDDLKLLAAKGYIVIINDDLTAYIKDWTINNQIRKDRYQKSIYHELLDTVDKMETVGNHHGNHIAPVLATDGCLSIGEVSIGEVSIGEVSIGEVSAEPETVSTPPPVLEPVEPPVILLPLNDGTDYPVTEEQVRKWESLYPAVDIMQQLRNMNGWLESNPTRRKTKRGIARFITGWLAKEQDRGGSRNNKRTNSGPTDWEKLAKEMEENGEL